MQEQDICSQINLISSIQYQKNELSKLATLLQSEKDREKYIKVIEMSKIIQLKLEYLQDEKKKSVPLNKRNLINSFGKTLDKKNSSWSLNQQRPELSDSSRSSSRSSNTCDTTRSNSYCGNSSNDDSAILFQDQSSRYHTYNGHSYRVIDRVTSLQFQSDAKYSRRPSADTILADLGLNQEKANSRTQQSRKISFAKEDSDDDDDDEEEEEEEEEEEVAITDIHIAVRRDASLFKIEKVPTTRDRALTDTPPSTLSIVKNKPIIPPIHHDVMSVALPEEPKILLTSPSTPQNIFDTAESTTTFAEPLLNTLLLLPHIIHVQKKTHQSLKGLLKRTYQLNQYTVNKTNSTTLPFSTGILYKTSISGKTKLLLKLVIVSLDLQCSEKQTRFGFTFWWQNHHTLVQRDGSQDDAKFALAPDSLVKESLVTWIESRNQEIKGVTLLPTLIQADEILRDGRKLYIVYDQSLFQL
ncbi:hypothetical protein MFLAVUS_004417 [Mucor flavus]|uniref:Uncharacterized protein n=1 Tax=Mucor flavus TaxID=439312 RepID=A0ABP9YVU9_9FUNG